MQEITSLKIQAKNKDRVNVFIDGEYAFATSIESVYKHALKVGKVLTEEEINALKSEDDFSVALSKALNYCTRSLKTRYQLKTYLERKEYPVKTINLIINKLTANGIVSDVEFAKRYTESVCKTLGKRAIIYKLISKGVSKNDAEYAYSVVNPISEESALYVLEKKLKGKQIDKDTLAKAYRYLAGRGFSYEEINFAMEKYKAEIETEY